MQAMKFSILAASILAILPAGAMAQTNPATRTCMQGEQEIGGVCQPLTRSPSRSNSDGPDTGAPDSTGSTGGGSSQGGGSSGGSDGQGGGSGGSGGGGSGSGSSGSGGAGGG